MKTVFTKFKASDTVEQIARGLKRRPRNYILYQNSVSGGAGYSGCIGGKAFENRKALGVVAISIFQ